MTREELKELSTQTFYDNNDGGITPEAHRNFNEAVIDFVPESPKQATNTELGIVKGCTTAGKIGIGNDGTMSVNGLAQMATFTIKSNEDLAAWANNAPGNDYTVVLIMPGTWTSNKEVNLTTAGTKGVIGMPGNVLSFASGATKGLCSDDTYLIPLVHSNYFMDGVNIVQNQVDDMFKAFSNIYNMHRCTVSSQGVPTSELIMFHKCNNLTDCFANFDNDTYPSIIGFANCDNLTNCRIQFKGRGNPLGGSSFMGFYACNSMKFCGADFRAPIKGKAEWFGAHSCYGMISCSFNLYRSPDQPALVNCSRMIFCVSTTDSGIPFQNCFVDIAKKIPVADTATGGYNYGS